MLRHLKLLQYLQEINLSPAETLALMRRLATESRRPDDYAGLIRIVRAHTNLAADLLEASPVVALGRPRPRPSARAASGAGG